MEIDAISRRAVLQVGAGLLGGTLLPHLPGREQGDTSVVQWNQVLLQIVRAVNPPVPVTARALAIVHTAMYDAWSAYSDVARSSVLGSVPRRPWFERTEARKREAISYAAYYALVDLFPSQIASLDTFIAQLGYNPRAAMPGLAHPSGIGMLAAEHVLAVRHRDGANQLGDLHPGAYSDYTGYEPVNDMDHIYDPNAWQPLRVSTGQGTIIQKCVTPFWGRVKPFALLSGSQLRPAGPMRYPEPGYTQQVQEILDLSANLTDEQKTFAEYWMDGAGSIQPPGHWALIAQYVTLRDHYDLDMSVQLFFMLGNALLDASIACWDTKMAYDSVRPITAIHYLFGGKTVRAWAGPYKGTQFIAGETWLPYQPLTVITPAFPEHCSGHSTFSAAGAEILRRFTGSDFYGASLVVPRGSSFVEPGMTPTRDITLSWRTFSEAAAQAGISRRYGGIHFQWGDFAGRELGRRVAQHVWSKAQGYINGSLLTVQ